MNSLTANDLCQTSANSVLMSLTSKTISSAIRGRTVDGKAQRILASAAAFLEKLVSGSLLVEDRQVKDFAPSHQGLREYVHAVSALQRLHLASKDLDTAQTFLGYRKSLIDLSEGKHVESPNLADLQAFVDTLSTLFVSELARPNSDESGGLLKTDH